MNQFKQVQRCNDLFRKELTDPKHKFSWQYADNLTISMRLLHSDGTPKWDYKANPLTGLIEPVALYAQRRIAPKISGSYVVAKFVPPCTEAEHRAQFGHMLEWPKHGIWRPMTLTALKPGVVPTIDGTWRVIRMIREQQATIDAMIAAMETEEERLNQQNFHNRKDQIKDLLPAFGNNPGKKEGVSFGGVDPSFGGVAPSSTNQQ